MISGSFYDSVISHFISQSTYNHVIVTMFPCCVEDVKTNIQTFRFILLSFINISYFVTRRRDWNDFVQKSFSLFSLLLFTFLCVFRLIQIFLALFIRYAMRIDSRSTRFISCLWIGGGFVVKKTLFHRKPNSIRKCSALTIWSPSFFADSSVFYFIPF